MAIASTGSVAPAGAAASNNDHSSYVDWPAIIGGVLLASAISFVLISFGAAVGLNFLDFQYNEDANPIFIGIAAAIWLLFVVISSYMCGAYLTGRLRRRHYDAVEHESDVRDGAHGLLVWAGSVIVGAVLVFSGVGAGANAIGGALSTVTTATANAAGEAADAVDPNAYFIDTLFRSNQPVDAETARAEAGRIFSQAALDDGAVSDEDRTYLANTVAANTGLTPEEAQARVDQVIANVENARQEAIEAARIARNTAIIGAFLLAATLLAAAVGAYWAAQKGGDHRDKKTVFTEVFRRF